MRAYATVDGEPLVSARVHVPSRGPWFADVEFESAPELSGRVTLRLGELELVGTIDPSHDGTHAGHRRSRIVAGAGGWGTLLAPKAYHNDAGVRARTVAQDAAREAGEELADDPLLEERVGVDYVRQAGPASRVLEDVLRGAGWWVDYDGVTRVGTRTATTVAANTYEVLEYVPDERVVVLAVDDLRAVGVGSVLTERLDTPQTVSELEINVPADRVRVKAWTGGGESSRGRLEDALRSIVRRSTDDRLFGAWRYRVVQMSGDRVELQAVRRDAGLPDVLPVSMWPGLAGAHAELTGGAEVLVEFIEGDRTMPVIRGFVGKGGPGHAPQEITISVANPGAPGKLYLAGKEGAVNVALAPRVEALIDKIHSALDALCAATPVSQDGGAALQTAVKTVWGPGVPSTPDADVGSLAVFAPRGSQGSIER